jgi:hypothetical protein
VVGGEMNDMEVETLERSLKMLTVKGTLTIWRLTAILVVVPHR